MKIKSIQVRICVLQFKNLLLCHNRLKTPLCWKVLLQKSHVLLNICVAPKPGSPLKLDTNHAGLNDDVAANNSDPRVEEENDLIQKEPEAVDLDKSSEEKPDEPMIDPLGSLVEVPAPVESNLLLNPAQKSSDLENQDQESEKEDEDEEMSEENESEKPASAPIQVDPESSSESADKSRENKEEEEDKNSLLDDQPQPMEVDKSDSSSSSEKSKSNEEAKSNSDQEEKKVSPLHLYLSLTIPCLG